jgi:8-oxo-dGTP pyrophosphatase MutT (NUDIX family)
MKKLLTLAFVHDRSRVLLGMKKRGFGEGRWNGFGGKVTADETIEEAARRELVEEAGIKPLALEKQGVLTFSFENDPQTLEVHVFSVPAFRGEPLETEEMRPQWFHHSDIPFDQMWPDDRHWLPLFLAGKSFTGSFRFRDTDTLLSAHVEERI